MRVSEKLKTKIDSEKDIFVVIVGKVKGQHRYHLVLVTSIKFAKRVGGREGEIILAGIWKMNMDGPE